MLSFALVVAACSGDGGPVTASTEPRLNVMVVDEGIDLSSPELSGKILATFTTECPDDGAPDGGAASDDAGSDANGGGDDGGNGSGDAGVPSGDGGPSTTFDERKRAYIAQLMTPGDSCHLVPGISAKSDPLATVSAFRDRWNSMLRGQRYGNTVFSSDEWSVLIAALDVEFKTFGYHGTATSGTIAHDNPGVRLVLVERQLAKPGSVATSFQCLVQADVNQSVALLADPDVRDAYLAAPPSPYTDEFRSIVAEYSVGIINESFGRVPRAVLEALQVSQGCSTPIALGPYFAAVGELQSAWDSAHGGPPPYVWTQSAGNESAQIDSRSDSYQCTPGDDRHLLVGSTDLNQARSAFSNHGACVDLYAPGEDIIAPYAGGWLLPVQGTSFAAPLVARLISRTAFSSHDPGVARQWAIDQRDGTWTIPIARFPRDFFYAPDPTSTRLAGALTVSPAPSTALPGPSGRRRNLDRIDWTDRTLWPLRALLTRPRAHR